MDNHVPLDKNNACHIGHMPDKANGELYEYQSVLH